MSSMLRSPTRVRPPLIISGFAGLTLLLFCSPARTPDSDRYTHQAWSIAAGQGFATTGHPETTLPPGFSVLLAGLFALGLPEESVRVVNVCLHMATVWLIWGALERRDRHAAALAAAAFAVFPWIARQPGYVLSETLTTFLCALLVNMVVRQGAQPTPARVLAIGAVALAIPLTAQALVVLSIGLLVVVAWRVRRRPASVLALFVGALAVWVPWQAHCVRATGSVQPFLYSDKPELSDDGFFLWFRTWRLRESDMIAQWHPAEFSLLPRRAFQDDAQRAQLADVRANYPFGDPVLHDAFHKAASARVRQAPFSFYVGLPVARATLLWFDMPDISHFRTSYVFRLTPTAFLDDWRTVGRHRAVLRLAKAFLSVLVWIFYAAYPLAFLWCAFRAVRSRDSVAIAIVLAVSVYTALSGWTAVGESRRNLPFFPALLTTLVYVPRAFFRSRAAGNTALRPIGPEAVAGERGSVGGAVAFLDPLDPLDPPRGSRSR